MKRNSAMPQEGKRNEGATLCSRRHSAATTRSETVWGRVAFCRVVTSYRGRVCVAKKNASRFNYNSKEHAYYGLVGTFPAVLREGKDSEELRDVLGRLGEAAASDVVRFCSKNCSKWSCGEKVNSFEIKVKKNGWKRYWVPRLLY